MGITALVMAGGKGTRLELEEEKPLLKIGGKSLIEHVLNALKNAKKVDDIIVATSKYTPKTAALARKLSFPVLETQGMSFCLDAGHVIEKLRLGTVMTISADLPLVTGKFIDEVITRYEQCDKPALTVMVPLKIYKRLGLSTDYIFRIEGEHLVPAGINMLNGKEIHGAELVEEEIFVVEKEEIAANVNTVKDLQIVERLFKRLKSNLSKSI
jgi:adenosylcobinamide-phosphate guanylyltransferase